MTNPTPHGQVPEALRLAEEITNLECSSEAAAKTIAAAADELCRLHVENASLRASPAASPAPPAEQQAAPKAAAVVWLSGKQLRGITALHGQYLPFRLQPEGRFDTPVYLEEAAPKAAPGEQDDHQILAITTAYEQGVGKGHQAYNSGKEIANPYSPAYRCDLAWQYGYKEGKEQAQREAKAAPQQEAQEPVAYVHVPHSTVEGKVRPVVSFEKYQQDYADGIYSTRIPLYAAPQPAPDCHHRPPCDECAALAAQGGKT